METLIEHAKLYLGRNLSVIPTRENKRPLIKWSEYQKSPMTPEEAEHEFNHIEAKGIGIICGEVSGNLEVIDIDCKNDPTGTLWSSVCDLAQFTFPDLFKKLVIAKTVNNGFHLYYRCKSIERNQPLSKNQKNEVLVETRGEGGYVIASPSEGYQFVQGDTGCIPEITPDERFTLLRLCRSFNEALTVPPLPVIDHQKAGGLPTFDDFNQRGDIPGLLKKHYWREVKENGERIYLCRSGKSNHDISASYHKRLRLLYVFTTSSAFDANRGYNAVQVYCILEAGGDYSRASKQLYEEGYGERYEKSSIVHSVPQPVLKPEISGLPIDGFPRFLQDFITSCAASFRTPGDYWAGAVMIATALGIGNKLMLSSGGYDNLPVFWMVIVGDVSSGKSEPLEFCLNYFQDRDSESIGKYHSASEEYERAFRLSPKERKEEGLNDLVRPKCFQYIIKDTTPEALAGLQDINKRGVLIHRDELKGMIDDFGRYNKGGEQANMLSSWSGKSMTFNRKTAGVIHISKPCMSICGTIQPDLLSSLADDNRAENGFLSRICAVFPDNTKKPGYCDKTLPPDMIAQWENYLSHLVDLQEQTRITLGEDSRKIYAEWYDQNADKTNNESIGYLKGVYGKLDVIALRLALLLHGMNLACDGVVSYVITKEEMKAAVNITEYFRATALKVYKAIFENKTAYKTDQKTVANYLIRKVGLNKSEAARALKTCRAQVNRVLIE